MAPCQKNPFLPAFAVFFLWAFHSPSQAQEMDSPPIPLKKLSLEELMDLDVTSVSKRPEPYGQAPAAIRVVTAEEIRRSGASSLPEALRLADNLDVAQNASSNWSISARGFNAGLANKLLVLMDGRAIYTPLFSGVFWNEQDYLLEDLDRIEAVSGPGGTLWGANAVNGVINILSKSARDTQGLYLEGLAGGGTWLKDFGGVRYGGALDPDIYYRVYGKYFERGTEDFSDGSPAPDSWRMGQGGFRADAGEGPRDHLTFQGDFYDSGLHVVPAGFEKALGANLLGRWSKAYPDGSSFSLQCYYDWTYLESPVSGSAAKLTENLDTYDLDFNHHVPLDPRNRLDWGLGYRFTHDVIGNTVPIAFLPPILDHQLFSGFLQDEIGLAEDLFLTLGSKLEHHDYTGFEVEPSIRLKWDVEARQMLWAAVSRAVRAPSRIDRDVVFPNTSTPLLTGGSSFQSEKLVAFELGYRCQWSRELSASLSTFFNAYDDLRSISPAPGTSLPYVIGNNLQGETGGCEFTADWQALEGWRLHAGYDLLLENLRVKPGATDANNGLGDTSDPANQLFLRSSVDLPQNLELDAGGRWVDARPIVSGVTSAAVPDYFELDARLGWRPEKNLEISVVGTNLLHEHHPEYGFPTPAREEIARGFYGKLSCRF